MAARVEAKGSEGLHRSSPARSMRCSVVVARSARPRDAMSAAPPTNLRHDSSCGLDWVGRGARARVLRWRRRPRVRGEGATSPCRAALRGLPRARRARGLATPRDAGAHDRACGHPRPYLVVRVAPAEICEERADFAGPPWGAWVSILAVTSADLGHSAGARYSTSRASAGEGTARTASAQAT